MKYEKITRELDTPREDIEGGKVKWHENHYKIEKKSEELSHQITTLLNNKNEHTDK